MKVIVSQDSLNLYEIDGLWGGWTDFGPQMNPTTILLNVKESLLSALKDVDERLSAEEYKITNTLKMGE